MKDESIGESLEVLIEQAEQLETLPEVTESIQTAIDSTGRINDEASYELKSVRGKIVSQKCH